MDNFLVWYLTILIIGILYLPLSMLLFGGWNDRGWIFSKALGILAGGFWMWLLSSAHVLGFTTYACVFSLLFPAAVLTAACAAGRIAGGKNHSTGEGVFFGFPAGRVLAEEALFFVLFGLAVYVIGFRPQAYGTEKFMDFGFVTSILRSEYMPFQDPWYAGMAVNYYYGGQFFTAFLIRLSRVGAGEGYTYMRALVTAFSFLLPFSLASQMMRDREAAWGRPGHAAGPAELVCGALAGFAVAFCGNMHYVFYGLLLPFWNKIRGMGDGYSYWFPDSTRFIGYFPETDDKTIHEFPCYSSVLGDLHAHYINLIFVVLVTAAAYAWARRALSRKGSSGSLPGKQAEEALFAELPGMRGRRRPAYELIRDVLSPEILLIGALTGLFRWTNFWDFPIYYVVCGAVLFFVNLRLYEGNGRRFWIVMLCQAAVMFLVGRAAAFPFTVSFDQISTQIGRTHSRSPLWQLLILWGLPFTVSICFLAGLAKETKEKKEINETKETKETEKKAAAGSPRFLKGLLAFFRGLALPDLCAAVFAMCAMGLVWLPEVIYVKDIYIESHYRANTMFKLTYQAFVLFGIVMAYALVRAIAVRPEEACPARWGQDECGETLTLCAAAADSAAEKGSPLTKEKGKRTRRLFRPGSAAASAGVFLLLLTGGFLFNSIGAWFGNVLDPWGRVGSDALVFIEESFPADYGAINWLEENVSGQPVILEADGDSYSDYGRVSVATGLPTVMGWYVHEWLWRNDTEDQNQRASDIRAIYTGTDREEVLDLIRRYDIRYIYIGMLEREKYPDLNEGLLREIGTAVFEEPGAAFILEFP